MTMTVNGRPVKTTSVKGAWVAICFGGVFVLVSPIWLVAAMDSPGFLIGFLLFAGIGGSIAAVGVKTVLARSAFRELALQLPASAPVGGTVQALLVLEPKGSLVVNGGSLKVISEEEAVYRAGTQSRTYRETVHESVTPLSLPRDFAGRQEVPLTLRLPPNAPPTFKGRNNTLRTRIEVHVDIDRWPDLTLDEELLVLPEVHR